MSDIKVGIIGFGERMQGVFNSVEQVSDSIKLTAITDIRNPEIKKELEDSGRNPSETTFYSNADEMLDRENLDAVMIGTRCSLHAQMAVKVLDLNLPFNLEKPVATTMDDLVALAQAAGRSSSKVVVSFPLRVTPLVRLAKEIIDSGKIGTVEHVQAFNNVPYGRVYYQTWYRDESETHGLFLQKATHDFDYINYLLGLQPLLICAMKSKRIYTGDHPANLRCADCAEERTCLEHPNNPLFINDNEPPGKREKLFCGFATDTGNEDSGSAIVMYETGMHVSYSQNFFARKGAAKRGATLIGFKGTIEFDWYKNELKVYMHHTQRTETYKMGENELGHGGGDAVLADNFVGVIRNQQESVAPISAGITSVLMCLKAKESAETLTFQKIEMPD